MKSIKYHLLALAIIVFASCQQEADFQDINQPPPPPSETFDSTQLVKSITSFWDDDSPNQAPYQDSMVERYAYDTTNKKITVSWESTDPYDTPGVFAVFSYNVRGFLTDITYHYPSGYTPYPGEYTNITISYDNEDILKTIELHFAGDPTIIKNYVKTVTGTGYRLDWGNVYNDPLAPEMLGDKQSALFDSKRNCISYQMQSISKDDNGDVVITTEFQDTIIYSSTGDLQKVYRRQGGYPNPEHLRYEFESRYDKGDQLGKQRQLLFKGIDNMQFENCDQWLWIGVLANTPDPYEYNQFTTFPFKTAIVYNKDTDLRVPFTSEATFDSLDRLTYFKGYFDDGPLVPVPYKIAYYK